MSKADHGDDLREMEFWTMSACSIKRIQSQIEVVLLSELCYVW